MVIKMEYSSKFSQEVKHNLESLRSAIDQDLGSLDNSVPNLTFSQADQILSGASSLLDSYKGFMGQLYRSTGRTYGNRRTSNGVARGRMEPAALETIQSQGYLNETDFVAKYGFNRNAVSRKLQELAVTYNWQRERTDAGWQYRPIVTKVEEPTPAVIESPVENTDAAKPEPGKTRSKRRQPTAPADETSRAGEQ